jgi:hypothetical protein
MLRCLRSILSFLIVAGCGSRPIGETPPSPPELARSPSADTSSALGSESNPIRGRGPFGEREYLQRLRCPDGSPPTFERGGSTGPGLDDDILDVYSVDCRSPGPSASVFMDMYHPDHRERRAIPGFTVLAELPARTALGCPPNVGPTADSSARYVFNYLEVQTPVKALNAPIAPTQVGFKDYVLAGFIVDTAGRIEPASLVFGDYTEAKSRAAAERVVLGLRFSAAVHHADCLVRQRDGIELELR